MRRPLVYLLLLLLTSPIWAEPQAQVEIHWEWLYDSWEQKKKGDKHWVGNGFFISSDHILTAGHCLPVPLVGDPPDFNERIQESIIRVLVRPHNSPNFYLVRVVYSDPIVDLAVLKVLGYKSNKWVKLGKPQLGEATIMGIYAGRGVREQFVIQAQIVILKFPVSWGVREEKKQNMLVLIPPLFTGASGSMILQEGKVVGVVVGSSSTITIAQPILKFRR